jgi:putative glutamine amidotransferase
MAVRIGITATSNVIDGRPVEELTRAYVSSVVRAGGMPLMLPVLDPELAPAMVEGIDGLLLSGGGDIEPIRYGEPAAPEVDGVDRARDAWELALVAAAIERSVPVLGICRGAQVLNVAAGGTLVQHLPDHTEQVHRDRERYGEVVHGVRITRGSRLARAMGRARVGVNTLHHQAVDQVGLGLEAVAWGPDGFVEAVESVAHARLLGVQWHPELLADVPGHPELFRWLVDEAAAVPDAAGAEIALVEAVA